LDELARDADDEASIVDATYVKAHQHCAGGKGGPKVSALDGLVVGLPQKFTLSSTLWEIQHMCTSRAAILTTSKKRQHLSRRRTVKP
jgi:hypothetical protein